MQQYADAKGEVVEAIMRRAATAAAATAAAEAAAAGPA